MQPALSENLGSANRTVVVHDHWHPYYTMTGVLHALCNAHHLRELKALVEIEKEDWARRMQRLLRRACHAVNLARAQNLPLRPEMIALIERCYDAVVADGLAYHTAQPALTKARPRGPPPRRVGHNLLLRLSTRKADVLRAVINDRATERHDAVIAIDHTAGGVIDRARLCPARSHVRRLQRIWRNEPPESRAGICSRHSQPNRRT